MSTAKTALRAAAVGVAVAAGALAVSTPASAYVACNRFNQCWRVHDRSFVYPGGAGIVVHSDRWWSGSRRHHRHWMDHRGYARGYWDRGGWRTF